VEIRAIPNASRAPAHYRNHR